MEVINAQVVHSICKFQDPCLAFCPLNELSGGFLLEWNSLLWQHVDVYVGSLSMSALVKDVRQAVKWVATSIYGPK